MAELVHGAIVLAAGGSHRLRQPKQLLELDGESLVRRCARFVLDTGPAHALVVIGAHAEAVEAALADMPIARLRPPDWEAGMGASLAAGLRALPRKCAGALVVVCDQPALDAALLNRLLTTWHADPAQPVATAYAGVIGVPAVLPRAWWPRIDARSDTGAREWLRADPARVISVPAPDLAHDIDTPADL